MVEGLGHTRIVENAHCNYCSFNHLQSQTFVEPFRLLSLA